MVGDIGVTAMEVGTNVSFGVSGEPERPALAKEALNPACVFRASCLAPNLERDRMCEYVNAKSETLRNPSKAHRWCYKACH